MDRSAAADQAQATQPGSLQSLFNGIWRRKGRFIAVFLTVIALTLVALLVLPVRYMATGSIIVAEQEPGVNSASAAYVQKIGDPADLESQLLVIRSPRVLRLAMTEKTLAAVAEECPAVTGGLLGGLLGGNQTCEKLKTDPTAFVDYVQNRYSIGAVGRSRVINISYTSPLRDVTKTMADALTTAFLEDQRAAGASSREVATSWLWQELKQLDTELRAADARIQDFRRDKGLMRGANAPISSERLSSISQQLATAESARADAAARLQEIKAGQARGASDAPSVLSSRVIADLKQQMTTISAQLASQSNVLGPRHPALRALEREQALVQQRLTAETASIAVSAQKTLDASTALVASLKKQLEAAKSEVTSATSDEASIESMVRGAEIKRQQYNDLYKRASELETERRVLIGSTRLVSLAELPSKPFFPKKIPFLAAGSMIGLLLAAAACLLGNADTAFAQAEQRLRKTLEQRPVAAAKPVVAPVAAPAAVAAPTPPPAPTPAKPEPSVSPIAAALMQAKSPPSEISTATGAPIFARLPRLQADPPASALGAILAGDQTPPLSRALQLAQGHRAMQDGLRQLNDGLAAATAGRTTRKILITSAGAGEGKTFLTLALAQMLAASGRRVLAIECDTRAPAFAGALGLADAPGLQDILRGDATGASVVQPAATANLTVITAGRAGPASSIGPRRKPISDLLAWADSYDVVLIDGPPPGGPSDALTLADQVDGVLLCTRWGRSSIGGAVATTSGIKAAGGRLLGMAVTMVKPETEAANGAATRESGAFLGAT